MFCHPHPRWSPSPQNFRCSIADIWLQVFETLSRLFKTCERLKRLHCHSGAKELQKSQNFPQTEVPISCLHRESHSCHAKNEANGNAVHHRYRAVSKLSSRRLRISHESHSSGRSPRLFNPSLHFRHFYEVVAKGQSFMSSEGDSRVPEVRVST